MAKMQTQSLCLFSLCLFSLSLFISCFLRRCHNWDGKISKVGNLVGWELCPLRKRKRGVGERGKGVGNADVAAAWIDAFIRLQRRAAAELSWAIDAAAGEKITKITTMWFAHANECWWWWSMQYAACSMPYAIWRVESGDELGHLDVFACCDINLFGTWLGSLAETEAARQLSSPCVFHFVAQTFYLWLEPETEMGSRHATWLYCVLCAVLRSRRICSCTWTEMRQQRAATNGKVQIETEAGQAVHEVNGAVELARSAWLLSLERKCGQMPRETATERVEWERERENLFRFACIENFKFPTWLPGEALSASLSAFALCQLITNMGAPTPACIPPPILLPRPFPLASSFGSLFVSHLFFQQNTTHSEMQQIQRYCDSRYIPTS